MLQTLIATIAVFGIGHFRADVDQIQRELESVWGSGKPARTLAVRCKFSMNVITVDRSLDDHYFPNTSLSGKTVNHRSWTETIAKRGLKYKRDTVYDPPQGVGRPKEYTTSRFFNGRESWVHRPENFKADQYAGINLVAKMNQDYYSDMIGFPSDLQLATRSVAGDTDEPFQLDQLIPLGKYSLAGQEVVDGITCSIIERSGIDRLWLGESEGWVIVKREWCWTRGGPLKRRIHNRDFREVAAGTWLPYESEMEIYGHPTTMPGKRVGILQAKVESVELDVPDEYFEPHLPKGTLVKIDATGERYAFGMEKETLDKAILAAGGFAPIYRPIPWWRRHWVSIGGVIVTIGIASIMIHKARRWS